MIKLSKTSLQKLRVGSHKFGSVTVNLSERGNITFVLNIRVSGGKPAKYTVNRKRYPKMPDQLHKITTDQVTDITAMLEAAAKLAGMGHNPTKAEGCILEAYRTALTERTAGAGAVSLIAGGQNAALAFAQALEDSVEDTRTLRQVLKEYEDVVRRNGGRGSSTRTIENKRWTLNREFADWLDKPVTEITGRDCIERYRHIADRDKCCGKGRLKPSTVGGYFRMVDTLLNFAIKRRWLSVNPLQEVKSQELLGASWPKSEKRLEMVQDHEVGALYRVLMANRGRKRRVPTAEACLLAWFMGLRISEVVRLAWEPRHPDAIGYVDMDWPSRTGCLHYYGHQSKNRKTERLPLSYAAVDMIEFLHARKRNGWVFPGSYELKTTHVLSETVRRNFQKWAVEAGIKQKLGLHALRKAATTMAARHMKPHVVKAMTRHAETGIMGHYIDIPMADIREGFDRIADAFLELAEGKTRHVARATEDQILTVMRGAAPDQLEVLRAWFPSVEVLKVSFGETSENVPQVA